MIDSASGEVLLADQKLLKSTGAGNLFMVFGEPDLELRTGDIAV